MRTTEILDSFYFYRGDLEEKDLLALRKEDLSSHWQSVPIPHDWAIEGPFDGWNEPLFKLDPETKRPDYSPGNNTGALPYAGVGIYFKSFRLPEEKKGKVLRLEFDGVMNHSLIYINGKRVAENKYGYTSFPVDITEYALFDGQENILIVKAENPRYLTRWYPGGGIYREVRLVTLEKRHFSYCGVTLDHALGVKEKSAILQVKAEGFSREELTLKVRKEGKLLAEGKAPLALSGLELWSPEKPVLYQVEVSCGSDQVEIPYGFREIVFDADKGMTLNGTPYRIKGLCMHHDLGVLGAAFDKDVMRWRLRKLKKIHCNSLRMAHNPPDPKLLDLCDEMGFLVMDEAFDVWVTPKNPGDYHNDFLACSEQDLRALIRRDRNHPSVMMWSIGNEIPDENYPVGVTHAERLVKICHEEDPTRPVTDAINSQREEDQESLHAFAETLDIIGFNYRPELYKLLHERFPGKPILGTETAAINNSRGVYYFPVEEIHSPGPRYSSAYALEHAFWTSSSESMFEALEACPWVLGEFAWCTFDYLGEPFPFLYPARSSAWGLFDLAGLPKDRAWLYAANWHEKGREEILHILPHWDWEEGEKIPIHVFSSCREVELFLNGRSLGKKANNGVHRLVWEDIPFEKGRLEGVGYDENGVAIARGSRVTPGEAAAIGVKIEREYRENKKGFYAFIELFMTDKEGEPIEKADDELAFTLENGLLMGVDNGDSCSLLPFKRQKVSLYNGHAMILAHFEEKGRILVNNGTFQLACEV